MQYITLATLVLTGAAFATQAQDCGSKPTCNASTPNAMLVSHSPHRANTSEKDIVATAVEAGNFRTLVAAVQAAELAQTLSGPGPFTVFAPTDAAFAQLPEGALDDLLKPRNKALLGSILTYHVVPGKVMAKDVVALKVADTVNGQRAIIQVDAETRSVMIGDAKVITTDIACSNGVIHVIDAVIMPSTQDVIETAVEAGSLQTLVAAIKAAGLVETLKGTGPFTVFAPTDEAFAALPAGTVETLLKPENKERLANILKHHVVAGRVFSDQALKAGNATTLQGGKLTIAKDGDHVMIGGAKLLTADVQAANGVIHVIDKVLLPQ